MNLDVSIYINIIFLSESCKMFLRIRDEAMRSNLINFLDLNFAFRVDQQDLLKPLFKLILPSILKQMDESSLIRYLVIQLLGAGCK